MDTLRARLVASLGLSLAIVPACGGKSGDDNCERGLVDTVYLDADTGSTWDECPTDLDDVQLLFDANNVACEVAKATLLEEIGQSCQYEYGCETCCGYGRPYLDEMGSPLEAGTRPSRDWLHGSAPPDVRELGLEERLAVGRYWLANARAEHSSIAGFHRFALDLLAHGAPPHLIERAQRAAMQELRHTRDCFTLASAYLGEPMGPAPMELGERAPIARSLSELAAWTVRDGAFGETLAAHLAARAEDETVVAAVQRVLATIVRDETDHAELAWATLQWALAVGGEPVRDAIAHAFDALGRPRSATTHWTAAQRGHGVAAPDEESARAVACLHEVVLPVARALLASVAPRSAV